MWIIDECAILRGDINAIKNDENKHKMFSKKNMFQFTKIALAFLCFAIFVGFVIYEIYYHHQMNKWFLQYRQQFYSTLNNQEPPLLNLTKTAKKIKYSISRKYQSVSSL